MGRLGFNRGGLGVAVLLALAALMPSACGSDSESGKSSTGGSGADGGSLGGSGGGSKTDAADAKPLAVSKNAACHAYVTAFCKRFAECWRAGADKCLVNLALCPDLLFSEGSARTADATLACSEKFATYSCDAIWFNTPLDCATAGTLKAGEPCLFASQCESLSCSSSGTSCGVCQRLANPGEDCSSSPEITCPTGKTCSGPSCVDTTLPTYLAAGAPCVNGDQCAVGYICFSDGSGQKCSKPPVIGDPCGFTSTGEQTVCGDALACDANTKCGPLPGVGSPCSDERCADGAYCNSSQMCVADIQMGQDCAGTHEVYGCADGLVCRCGDGTPAQPNITCGASAAATCFALRDETESCAEPQTTCADGTECKAGVCVAIDSKGLFEKTCGG